MLNGARRRRESFFNSVERANICTVHARTLAASRAATPYVGRCKLALAPAVRANAQPKYSKRFHAAYGHHCSRAGTLRRSTTPKSQPPRTNRPTQGETHLTVTSLADPNHCHHQTILSLPTDSPPTLNRACPRHEPHQDVQWRHRRFVSRPRPCAESTQTLHAPYGPGLRVGRTLRSSSLCSRKKTS